MRIERIGCFRVLSANCRQITQPVKGSSELDILTWESAKVAYDGDK